MSKNEINEADFRNGFTRIPNSIQDALPRVGLNGTQHDICHILLRETYGWNRCERAISVGEIAQITGMSKRFISKELGELARRFIIVRHPQPGKTTSYQIQTDVSRWISTRKHVEQPDECCQSDFENRGLYLVEGGTGQDQWCPNEQQNESSGVNYSDRGVPNNSSGVGMNNSSEVQTSPAQADWASRAHLKKELKKVKDNCYIYTRDSTPYRLSYYLLENIRENQPGFMEPDIQKWSKVFDDMIKQDKRSQVVITDLIDFAQNDTFWRSVILNPNDLQRNYDRLNSIMHSKQKRIEDRMDRERDAEIARSLFREDEYRRSSAKRDSSYKSRRVREKEDWETESDEDEYEWFFKK